jgi:valyl-tRNA synthetase
MLLQTVLKLFAPFLPYITEEIYQGLFAEQGRSIHLASWPEADANLEDGRAEALGETLVAIATAVRRYKSERSLPLGKELALLQLVAADWGWGSFLQPGPRPTPTRHPRPEEHHPGG